MSRPSSKPVRLFCSPAGSKTPRAERTTSSPSIPKSVQAQILKGNALAGLKDLDGAISQIEDAIKTDPTQSASYGNLGVLLQFVKGDTAKAEEAFQKAVSIAPDSASARLSLANFYWSAGRRSDAERVFRETLAIEPRNLLANRALVMFYMGSGRIAEAEQPLKIVAEETPGSVAKLALADYYSTARRLPEARTVLTPLVTEPIVGVEAKLRLARLAVMEGDRSTAYRLVDEVLARQAKNAEALIAKTLLQASDHKPAEALTTIQAAVTANPGHPPVRFVLGKMLTVNARDDEAMETYREVLRLNPNFAQAELELARLSLQALKYDDAIQFAQSAVNTLPGYADAHLVLTQALIAKGETGLAEKSLKLLTDNFSGIPAVQSEVGRLMLAKGQPARARAAFEKALAADPTQAVALEGLTRIDLEQRNIEEARARIDAALKAAPQNSRLHVVAARQYVTLGDEGTAEQVLKHAIQTDATNLRAYDLLARLYVKQRRLAEATAEFEKLSALRPRDVAPRTAVALLQQLQNQWDQAEASYKQVLALDPRAAVAANNLAQLYAERNGDLDVALQLAQTAKAALPNVSEVDDTLGYIFYKKKLPSVAIASLRLSVAAQPNNPVYLYHLGLAYAQNGDTALARESLENALKNQPDFDGADDARKLLNSLKS